MKKYLTQAALAAAVVFVSAAAQAAVLYDRSTLGNSYSPPGANVVIFDDVPLPLANIGGTPPTVDIGRLSFDVFLNEDVTAEFHATAYVLTVNPNNNSVTSVTPVGSITFPVGTTSDVYTLTYGTNNDTTIATVTPDYSLNTNFGFIFLGLAFDSDADVGPVVSTGPDSNADAFGLYDLTDPNSPVNGYGYAFSDETIPNAFSIIVESPVPEPAAFGLFAPAGLLLARRRRA
jgi:hypothetical protein